MSWRTFVGVVLLVFGAGFLLDQLEVIEFGALLATWWPLIIIAIAIIQLVTRSVAPSVSLFLLLVGAYLQVARLDMLRFDLGQIFWPSLLILAGLYLVLSRSLQRPAEASMEDRINSFVIFGGTEQRLESKSFRGGSATTLFGGTAKGAYLYDGKEYLGAQTHVEKGFDCTTCHNVHALEVKTESCVGCHPGVKDVAEIRMGGADYDGDGDSSEGIRGEVETMTEALYAQIKVYATAKGTGIVYNPATHPYFFVDNDADGKTDKDDKGASIRYNAFTPRLMKAAYNYQYAVKDTGAWVHNGKFVIQFLIDSIEDLGGDVSMYTRP